MDTLKKTMIKGIVNNPKKSATCQIQLTLTLDLPKIIMKNM